jgi:hypothetical protein
MKKKKVKKKKLNKTRKQQLEKLKFNMDVVILTLNTFCKNLLRILSLFSVGVQNKGDVTAKL